MKMIDKSALVAEIEKRKESLETSDGRRFKSLGDQILWNALNSIQDIIKSLEVKGTDFCTEVYKYIDKYFNVYDDGNQTLQTKDKKSLICMVDVENIAKHFFELGLQAQHDNWKVIGNTNLPQADKNKIYCVFTKDRYILAKVIDHPQDEELLQWKCTEFPHHRYDMCEGDKYMQIV